MAIEIRKAILHILDNNGPILSQTELEIDSETTFQFVSKHAKSMLNNAESKEAFFEADSEVYKLLNDYKAGDIWFKDMSLQLSEMLVQIIEQASEFPSGDLLITHFQNNSDQYLGIFKLNYKECVTHYVNTTESGMDNQLITHKTILAGNKVDEGCIIKFDPVVVRLFEKPYIINNESVNYFSQLFLKCSTKPSKKESVSIINEVVDEINHTFFNKDFQTKAKLKATLYETTEQSGNICAEKIAEDVFRDSPEAKNECISKLREAGIREDIEVSPGFVKQQFGIQKLKASNGVEIKFPSTMYDDPDTIEIIKNPNGTVSIIIKNLCDIEAM